MNFNYTIMNIVTEFVICGEIFPLSPGPGKKISKIFPNPWGKFSKIINQEYEIKKYKNR